MTHLLLSASKNRTWFYTQKPGEYEVYCDQCKGNNTDWSEFKKMIWCHDCNLDTYGTDGVFGGPIPIRTCAMLGMFFHIYHIRLKKVLYLHANGEYWGSPEGLKKEMSQP